MRLKYGVGVETTETFRWAMYKSPHGYGFNAQTSPKALRYYCSAPTGRVYVGGDLSQAEARVVAYLSRCRDLIDLFNDPKRHVHSENALVVFGRPVEKDSPEYVLAKAVVHASNYREGPYRFSTQAGIPASKAKQLLAAYHAKRPEIHKWHDWVWQEIKTKGKLTTTFGDERVFYEAISCFSLTGKMADTHWKDAIAWVPQSIVPGIIDRALIEMSKVRDSGMDIWFHHQGHDSFLCSVPIGEEVRFFDAIAPIFAGIKLTSPAGVYTIPNEFSVGYSFGDMFGYSGSAVPMAEWQARVDGKLAKKPREQQILEGAYGVHLMNWRP
jgi:hypothetical protein